jgi:hypothetical protein
MKNLSGMEKQAMWNGFFSELDKISFQKEARVRAAVLFEKISRKISAGKEKRSAPAWVGPTVQHALMGAVPGAVGGAVVSKPGEKKRGAVKGAIGGAVAGAAGGHLAKRVARDHQAVFEAARKHGHNDISEMMKRPKIDQLRVHQTASEIKKNRPLYGTLPMEKTSTKKNDPWERSSDSFITRHKKGIAAAGLAAALGAGVGHKLYKSPKVQARLLVRRRIKDWKSVGGKKPSLRREIYIGHTGEMRHADEKLPEQLKKNQDAAARHGANYAKAKAENKRFLTVDPLHTASMDDKGDLSIGALARGERANHRLPKKPLVHHRKAGETFESVHGKKGA